MRISDWSSDVCSSDLGERPRRAAHLVTGPDVDGVVDTMVGFPTDPDQMYAVMRRELLRDSESQTMAMPAEYMFHDVPEKEIDRQADPVAITIAAMDQHGIGVGLVSVSAAPELAARALRDHPARFVASETAAPTRGQEGRRALVRPPPDP